MQNSKRIGEIILARRIQMRFTQPAIAKACGVSPTTVCRWETGYIQNMKVSRLMDLAKVLNMSVQDLLSGENVGTGSALTEEETKVPKAYREADEGHKELAMEALRLGKMK